MALTAAQKSSKLFKKSLGFGETNTITSYFEEKKAGSTTIFPEQIWTQGDQIPDSPDSNFQSSGQVIGVVKYLIDVPLTVITGSEQQSYYSSELVNAIPFTYGVSKGGGGYNYTIKDPDGNVVPEGTNDWVVDTEAGLLTFYNGRPDTIDSNNTPTITFYRYEGETGLPTTGTSNFNFTAPILFDDTTDTISHGTSTGTSSTNVDNDKFIKDIEIDDYGHITTITSEKTVVNTKLKYQNAESVDALYDGDGIDVSNNIYGEQTNIQLSVKPATNPKIQVYVNGQRMRLGESEINSDCWFGTTSSALSFTNLDVNSQFVWNANKVGFKLDTEDKVDIIYEIDA